MQQTTIRQQRLNMGLVCTVKKLSTHWLNHWNVLLVRIQIAQGISLLMDTSGLMTSYQCCRSTTHPALYVETGLLRMVNVVMMAMTSKRMDVTPVCAKEVLKTNKKGLAFKLKLSGGL